MSRKTGLHRIALTFKGLGVAAGILGFSLWVLYHRLDSADPLIGGAIAAAVLWTLGWILDGFIAKDAD